MLNENDLNILIELKKRLQEQFGELIKSLYAFGSRVKAYQIDHDFDLLITISHKIDWLQDYELSKAIIDYGIDNDIVFDPHFFTTKEFESTYNFHPFIKNIKAEGVRI